MTAPGLPYQVTAIDGHPGREVDACVGEHLLTLSDLEGPALQINGAGAKSGVVVEFQQQNTGYAVDGRTWRIRRGADGALCAEHAEPT